MRYIKKPVKVEAWEWKPSDAYAAGIVLGRLHGYDPRIADDQALMFWCEKGNALVTIPVGGYVIAELDGKGYYPCTALDFSVLYTPDL